jgi:hypothetical protein
MSKETMGRRDAAKRMLMVLGAAAVGPSVLAACGGEEGGDVLNCTDISGLSPAEITTRQSQAYSDISPHADKHCNNCNFFTAGQANACGSCTVIKGPIHPEGYCNLWAAKV